MTGVQTCALPIFPAGMATRKIGPAIAAGCTMILKPAGETPLTALAIADILDRCGLPKGVLNVILPPQSGPAISKVLHDPRVKNLSFTGSTQVGKILIKEAAERFMNKSAGACSKRLNICSRNLYKTELVKWLKA